MGVFWRLYRLSSFLFAQPEKGWGGYWLYGIGGYNVGCYEEDRIKQKRKAEEGRIKN